MCCRSDDDAYDTVSPCVAVAMMMQSFSVPFLAVVTILRVKLKGHRGRNLRYIFSATQKYRESNTTVDKTKILGLNHFPQSKAQGA